MTLIRLLRTETFRLIMLGFVAGAISLAVVEPGLAGTGDAESAAQTGR